MEGNAVDAINLAGSVGAADFSVWSLFMRADWVVKLVIIMLLAASIWSWAIIFDKVSNLRRLNKLAREFENTF
ncbi:MAG: Tol-Pal system subunit TolQ, partial [Rhodospirillaceae bacterium]|nr:Tol-Pal system subunit TolQ [Rhodospirillaceae bacterium]